MAILEINGLTKRYGNKVAVDDMTFSCEEGRVVGFLGPNGAGKTTTLQMLLGLIRSDAGDARIAGRRFTDLERPATHVGALLGSGGFHPNRTARRHLEMLARAAQVSRTRVDEVLEEVELTEDAGRRAGGYSHGMQRRLGLAAALLGDPRVLVLDEPANGLDPVGIRWLRLFIRRFAAEGGTVLISSHVLAEVEQTVDDIVIIARGRRRAAGSLDELLAGSSIEELYLDLTSTEAA